MAFKQYHFQNREGNRLDTWTVKSNQYVYDSDLITIEDKKYRVLEVTWDMFDRNVVVVEEEK